MNMNFERSCAGLLSLIFLVGAGVETIKAQMKTGKPSIISRKDWNAKEPVGAGKKHKILAITIHHTATVQKPEVPINTKMRNLQAFSQRDDTLSSGKAKPAWFDIPYHFYIGWDGVIAQGREIEYAGDTNTEYDPTGHALVVLEGSFGTENPSSGQIEAMKNLVVWLARTHNVSAASITGHDDHAKTGCPGKNLKKHLPELRSYVEKTKAH